MNVYIDIVAPIDTMETDNKNTKKEINKTRKINSIPAKQSDMLSLAESVADKWMSNPKITLQWIKVEDFTSLVQKFGVSLGQRIQAGSGRQSTTKQLQNIDTKLNKAVEELKIAILGKFGKENGKSYFSEFGIARINKGFAIPKDRNQRQQALLTLIQGLEKHQINIVEYPLRFFKDIQKQYDDLISEAKRIDSTVSAEVGTKNELIKQITKVLNALIWIIKGNYPNTYKTELRAWGFQKEKY